MSQTRGLVLMTVLGAALAPLGGCWGTIGDPGDSASRCGPMPESPLRRLSHTEFRNTVRDLFPGTELPSLQLAADPTPHGFDNDASSLQAAPLLVTQYNAAAVTLSDMLGDDLAEIVPCAAAADQACGHAWIDDFAVRAFRRPLSPSEKQVFVELFDGYLAMNDFRVAMELTTQAILQAPQFLYRIETGSDLATQFDVASRLSYLLWATMPDATLFEAARRGELATPEQVSAQVDRMLADPRALEGFMTFTSQWMELAHLDRVSKHAADGWSEDVRAALREEARRFLQEVIFRRGGTLTDFLLSSKTFVNADTAAFYGLPAPADWTEVELPPDRVGFLMQAQFLASNGHPDNPSPVLRGLFVLRNFLCIELGSPPAGVNMIIPGPEAGVPTTNRQNYDRVTGGDVCASCHSIINPIGFAFEEYDSFGRHRTEDNGLPVDANVVVQGTPISGAKALAEYLSTSAEVQQCVAGKYLTYATGGVATGSDQCLAEDVQADLAATGGSLTHLMKSIATHPRFLGTGEERLAAVTTEGGQP